MMSICLRYAKDKDEANHLLNTSFTKAVIKIDTYTEDVPFKFWLRRITVNHIIDQFRMHKTYQHHLSIFSRDAQNGKHASNTGAEKLEFENLLSLLDRLPPTTKDVFNLFAIDGYSHKEIARMLDISDGTSKWHVSSARKKLQKMLLNQQLAIDDYSNKIFKTGES